MNVLGTDYREQQRQTGFNTKWLEQHGWGLAPTPSMPCPAPALPALVLVTAENEQELRRSCLLLINELKEERPCVACGAHPCPPGSSFRCAASTDELLNSPKVIRTAMVAFEEQYGHPYA